MTFLLEDGMVLGGFFLLSCIISFYAIPLIIKSAKSRRLFDHPDYNRKIHSEATPTLGGIAIFIAFLLSYSISPWSDSMPGFSYFIASLLILFFVGLKDDLIVLSANKKLLAQVIAGLLVIFGSGIRITGFQGVFGVTEIPYWLTILITLFTIIVVINAVNLIDGIDGLAGGIGTLASLFFGIGFLTAGQWPMAALSFCLAGALLGFLWHNFSPASIFMGDTGSILLGFLLSVQAVAFLQLNTYPGFHQFLGDSIPVLTVSILAFPLFDTLRVVFKRYWKGKPIFSPDQDHIHHEMLRMGFSHSSASILLYMMNIVLIGFVVALAFTGFNVNLILVALFLVCLLIYPTNGFKRTMVGKLFGYKWQKLYSRKWGIHLDQKEVLSLSLEDQYDSDSMPDERKDEKNIDKVAV